MPGLFYKDLKAHEAAYRNTRADEATNDILLGAKLNAYLDIENAQNHEIDQIAESYGKFLKALQTKVVPLIDRSASTENDISQIAQASDGTDSTNLLMSSSQYKTAPLSEPSSSVIAGLNAILTPEQQRINNAINKLNETSNVFNAFKAVNAALSEDFNDTLITELKQILHDNGFRASTGKKKKSNRSNLKTLKKAAIDAGLKKLQTRYFKPTTA